MFTLAQEETSLDFFSSIPERIRAYISAQSTDRLLEVRLRIGSPLTLIMQDGTYYISRAGNLVKNRNGAISVTSADIMRGMELITRSSVYAFENEIKNGYITLPKGHRVGICGDVATSDGKPAHLRYIQSLNYRFAREIKGAANSVIDKIFDGSTIKNTLIVSPPMCGKTTLLRDIARLLSESGKRVSIVDERGEIAALYGGVPSFDLAECDVLSGVNKADGMILMLRSMSPDVIITDEIGGKRDLDAIEEIKKRGVSIITTLHGKNTEIDGFDLVIQLEGIEKCSS